jgi:hypothetical protein
MQVVPLPMKLPAAHALARPTMQVPVAVLLEQHAPVGWVQGLGVQTEPAPWNIRPALQFAAVVLLHTPSLLLQQAPSWVTHGGVAAAHETPTP